MTDNIIIDRYEDSAFIKVLSFVYQAGSNSPAYRHQREELIEHAISSMMKIREREIDNNGNKITWDDAALRSFEGLMELMVRKEEGEEGKELLSEGQSLTLDEWLEVMRLERGDKEEEGAGESGKPV